MKKESYSIFQHFLLATVALSVSLAIYISAASTAKDSLDVADFNSFSLGPWNATFPMFSYFPQDTIQILEAGDGNHYIQATMNNLTNYAGFGLFFNQSVPRNAFLVFQIQSTSLIPNLQVDVVDGSRFRDNVVSGGATLEGEHFSHYLAVEESGWQTFSFPIDSLERNAYQSETNPNDGILDTDPIQKVEFVFEPGTSTQFSVKQISFVWQNTKWYKVLSLSICSLLGIFLLLLLPRGDIQPESEHLLFSHSFAVTIVYVLIGLSLIFLLLSGNTGQWSARNNIVPLTSLLLLLLCDGFFRPQGKAAVLWTFRYLLVFILGNLFAIPLIPFVFFLLFLAACVPVIQQRLRKIFFAVPLAGLIGLCVNAHASNAQTFLYMVYLIVVVTILSIFIHSILLHYRMSLHMGHLTFLYEDLFNNTADAIYTVDDRRIIQNVNSGFEKMVGTVKEHIINNRLEDFLHIDDVGILPNELDFHTADNIKYEIRFVTQSNEIRFTSVNECMIKQGSSFSGFQAIAHDITLHKEYEKNIRNAKEIAENASHLKSQFLANMSHELRTPLNSIIGFTSLLRKNKNGSLTSKEIVFLEKVYDSSLFLLTLINNILDLSKIEAGKMEIVAEPISLEPLITDAVNYFEIQIAKKGLRMTVDCPQFQHRFWIDHGKVKQVLNNLIENAIKFTHQGEITISVREKESTRSHSFLMFQIIDTGIGIDRDKQGLIFDSFTQADGSKSRKYAGTGLGLSISKKIIELMGGKIGVESEIGKGSKFWFELLFKISNHS